MVFTGDTHSIKLSSKYTSNGSYAMFSDHVPKIGHTNGRNVFVIAGALLIFCQLVAMVFVADGQVKKAELRANQLQNERMFVAQCLENVKGVAVSTCTDHGSSDDRQPTILSRVGDSTQDRN